MGRDGIKAQVVTKMAHALRLAQNDPDEPVSWYDEFSVMKDEVKTTSPQTSYQ